MTLNRITIILEPPAVEPPGLYEPPRPRYEEFAAALSRYTEASISVIDGQLKDAPADGAILLYGGSELVEWAEASANQRALQGRVMLMEAQRTTQLDTLETFGLAGSIEARRFWLWHTQRADESGRHLFGLKSVAASMGGAKCSEPPFASEHYAEIEDLRQPDLPALLVAYLEALTADPVFAQRRKTQ
jgi:hypothetical protein